MTELKIGSRVKVTDKNDCCCGFVGKIDEIKSGEYAIKFNNGRRVAFEESQLQKVSPSFETLLVGDIVIGNAGESKVLEVGQTSFLISEWNDFIVVDKRYTFEIAKIMRWKVKGQVEQMTVQQISKELGREIKVVEE